MKLKEYRGHIRNWKALCEELAIDPSLAREEREREIVQKAFDRWQDAVGEHLIGMFAFALEEEESGDVFACRDPFGTKPFYYYVTEDHKLLCGTFIRPILHSDGFVKELNPDMLQLYLTLTYVAGEDTFFQGLKKLMPGHTLRFHNGEVAVKRYFAPTFTPDESKTLEEWADEIHATLQYVMTEVKEPSETAESFLSGGVDSSYVLAMSDAKTADMGSAVVAIGCVNGTGWSVDFGLVNGDSDSFSVRDNSLNLMQTNMVRHDNAFGVLVNASGEVVGILSEDFDNGNCLRAIAVDKSLLGTLNDMLNNDKTPVFGAYFAELSAAIRKREGIKGGIRITEICEGTPADEAGFRKGDTILAVQDETIYYVSDFNRILRREAGVGKMRVTYLRGGKEETVEVTITKE